MRLDTLIRDVFEFLCDESLENRCGEGHSEAYGQLHRRPKADRCKLQLDVQTSREGVRKGVTFVDLHFVRTFEINQGFVAGMCRRPRSFYRGSDDLIALSSAHQGDVTARKLFVCGGQDVPGLDPNETAVCRFKEPSVRAARWTRARDAIPGSDDAEP